MLSEKSNPPPKIDPSGNVEELKEQLKERDELLEKERNVRKNL